MTYIHTLQLIWLAGTLIVLWEIYLLRKKSRKLSLTMDKLMHIMEVYDGLIAKQRKVEHDESIG